MLSRGRTTVCQYISCHLELPRIYIWMIYLLFMLANGANSLLDHVDTILLWQQIAMGISSVVIIIQYHTKSP